MILEAYLNYDSGSDRPLLIDGAMVNLPPLKENHEFMVRCLLFALAATEIAPFDCLVIQSWEVQVPAILAGDPINRYPDLMLLDPQHLNRPFSRRLVPLDKPAPPLVVELTDQGKPLCPRTLAQYAARGIPEHWQIDSETQTVTVRQWRSGQYEILDRFIGETVIATPLFPEGATVPAEIFELDQA
ncbi:MAG: Uma2 family endonuclease [Alkalinema sp. RU_4_3]|nr:Uma2 family endonuclease [Alkalinema sp. RU_4_3]